ncbi:MAG: hypothetical protein HOQ22_12395 [Nocardioidaceae bacterium]|nr:hypothetical protein [Nocardioidaceae bacterium]NUS51820.1 hypothetical protein [Nocardioidaceae bacterium]
MANPVLVVSAAERAAEGIDPLFVGGGIFLFLLILMGGLLAFGAGRDHS